MWGVADGQMGIFLVDFFEILLDVWPPMTTVNIKYNSVVCRNQQISASPFQNMSNFFMRQVVRKSQVLKDHSKIGKSQKSEDLEENFPNG